MKKTVLFLTFNRLDTTKQVFEQIKIAKPPKLYLASDGPRKNKKDEAETVKTVRNWLLENINWDCEVKTLFRDENLGCGKAVSSAITWFFEQEEDGIILEDDCLPNQSFFKYCEELLDYYKDNKNVWVISGDQFVEDYNNNASYYFAKIMHCWGWASWADRWKHYQFDLKDYDEKVINNVSEKKYIQKYWLNILNTMKEHKVDTWDYQWALEIIKHNGFCINPSVNLVSNIGLVGTHYENAEKNPMMNLPTFEIEKIIHPNKVEFDIPAVNYIYEKVFSIKRPGIKDIWKYISKRPFFMFKKGFYKLLKEII